MTAATVDLEQAVSELNEKVKTFTADQSDGNLKSDVYTAARKVMTLTQNPDEQWLWHSVNMSELAAIATFMKWKAFDAIPKEGSISYKDLAEKCNATEGLTTRIAWMMVAGGTLKQIGEDQVAHTPNSLFYTNNNPNAALFKVMMDEAWVPYGYHGEYFDKYGRKEPTTQDHTPYSYGYGDPPATIWQIMNKNPERMKEFMQSMNTMEHHLPVTGMYDFSWVVKKGEEDPKRVLFVDVGGGKGQALKAITKEYPIPLSQCVLQDMAPVIEEAKALDAPDLKGATLMPHDFHKTQPVKGAAIYWIRRCLHDYGDEVCTNIIKQLADAMAPDSKLLIVEQILSNPPSPLVAYTDFVMLNVSGKERTLKMFGAIAEPAGLKVTNLFQSKTTPVGVVELSKV